MKKYVLGLALAASAGCALAEWAPVSSAPDGSVVYYVDSTTIRKSGTRVQVATLTDFKEAQVVSKDLQYLSARMQDEFNCVDRTGRHLNLAALSENMGKGKVVGRETKPADWRQITAETADEQLWKFVCEKN